MSNKINFDFDPAWKPAADSQQEDNEIGGVDFNYDPNFKMPSAASRIAKGLGLDGGDYDESSIGGQMITPTEAAQNSKEYAKQEQAEFDKKYARLVREQALKDRNLSPEDIAANGDSIDLSEEELKAASKRLGYEGMNRNVQQIAGDLSLSGVAGVKQLAKAGVDLVAPASETAQYLNESIAETNSRMSPEMRQQLEWYRQQINDAEAQGRGAEFAEAFGNLSPQLAAHYMANTLPSMAPVIGAGKVAQGLATARGATAAGAALAGARGAGVANAALNAGGARGDAFEELKQTYMDKGASEDQAIDLALSDSWIPAGGGAATGYVGGRFGAESDIIRDSVTTAAKFGVLPALKAVVGSLFRELTTEQAEELLPKITTNLLAEKDPLDGIAEVAAQTFAGSVGMGSVGAASAGREAYRSPLERELQGFADAVDGTKFNPAGNAEEARRAAAGMQPLSVSGMAELQAMRQQQQAQPPAPNADEQEETPVAELPQAVENQTGEIPQQADIDQAELLNQIEALTQPPEIEQQPNSPLTNAANQAQGVQQAAELAKIRQELVNAVTSTGEQNASEPEQVAQEAAQANDAQAGAEPPTAQKADGVTPTPGPLASRTPEQLSYLAQNGQGGRKEEAIAELARRGIPFAPQSGSEPQKKQTKAEAKKAAKEMFDGAALDARRKEVAPDSNALSAFAESGKEAEFLSLLNRRKEDKSSLSEDEENRFFDLRTERNNALAAVENAASQKPQLDDTNVADLNQVPDSQIETKQEEAKPAQGSSAVKSNLSPIQRRDDLVGAIMRVTGGSGISAGMAQTIVGDTANNATKVRGLFTNAGVMDLDDTADLLRNEEGYDVRDGNHLAELIREQAAGNPVYSSARIEREAAKDAEKKHREEVLRRAKKYGVRHVARPFSETEDEVFRIMEERHIKAVQLLDDRSFTRFSAMLDAAQRIVSYEDLDAIVTDAHNRFEGRKVWDEARKQIRAHISDLVQAEKLKRQESQNAIEIEGQPDNEPDWISDGQPIEGLGGGSAIDRINEAGEGQATPEGSGGSQEEFSLVAQSEDDVRAQERQREEADSNRLTKEQIDRERDAVPFSLAGQSQPRPQGVQVDMIAADGRISADAAQPADQPRAETVTAPAEAEVSQPLGIASKYKAGDRVVPDVDVIDGDIVRTDDGKLWISRVKRGRTIPVNPFVDGMPQISADTATRFDLDEVSVTHTGTNFYGHGGLPKPTAEQASIKDQAEAAKPEQNAKLTAEQAEKQMEWRNLGQTDGTKTHALFFYETQEDMDAKRGQMQYGVIESFQAGKWTFEGDSFPDIKGAKWAAKKAAIARLKRDGYVESSPGSQPPKDQGAAAFKSGAERKAPEGLSIADKARWLGGYDDAKAEADQNPIKNETPEESTPLAENEAQNQNPIKNEAAVSVQSTTIESRGATWRIDVHPSAWVPGEMAWSGYKRNAGGEFVKVESDDIPAGVAKKAAEFFDSVVNPASDLLDQVGDAAVDAENAQESKRDELQARIEDAAQKTNHDATPAQKEAGNYAKGKFAWNGLTISVETAKGEDRTDKETNGDKWRVTMPATYGYILGTKGADKDHVDLFMGDNPESESVFVVNQNQVDSQKFDEHKVMAGFASAKDAQAAYMASFEDGFGDRVFGSITGPYSIKEFREMLDAGKFEKPQSIGAPISPLSMIDVQLDGETMSAEQAIKDIDDQLSLADKLLNCVTN